MPQENWIFENIVFDKECLLIPVDKVICEVLNKFLNIEENKLERDDFKFINNCLAKKIFKNDYFLVEELWFWGFFTQNKEREVVFNDAKFYTDLYIVHTNENENKFEEFIGLFNA